MAGFVLQAFNSTRLNSSTNSDCTTAEVISQILTPIFQRSEQRTVTSQDGRKDKPWKFWVLRSIMSLVTSLVPSRQWATNYSLNRSNSLCCFFSLIDGCRNKIHWVKWRQIVVFYRKFQTIWSHITFWI